MNEFIIFQKLPTKEGMYELTCKWLEFKGMEYKTDVQNGEYLILLQQQDIDVIYKMILENPRFDHRMKDDLGIWRISDSALNEIADLVDEVTSGKPEIKPAVNPTEYQMLSDYGAALLVIPGIFIGLRILMNVKRMPDEDGKINRSKQERKHAFNVIGIAWFSGICWYVIFTKLL